MTVDTDALVEDVRALAAVGKTDRRISVRLGISYETVKRIRRENGITAGFKADPAAGSIPSRKREPARPLPTPLSPTQLSALRIAEADALRGEPAKRGWCADCRQWLLLHDGLLPQHRRDLPGMVRGRGPQCPQWGSRPMDPADGRLTPTEAVHADELT